MGEVLLSGKNLQCERRTLQNEMVKRYLVLCQLLCNRLLETGLDYITKGSFPTVTLTPTVTLNQSGNGESFILETSFLNEKNLKRRKKEVSSGTFQSFLLCLSCRRFSLLYHFLGCANGLAALI